MSSLKVTFGGYARYRGREGQLSFILHRISGLATLLFLTIHILDTSTVYFFPSLYEHAINIYRLPLMGAGEMALVAGVIYHGVNGLRISLFDWKPGLWNINTERKSVIFTIVLSFLLWLPVGLMMGYNILSNEPFHLFGG
jgi:succinate dehydrogenase / fumarate reductase cytochrome b subunit